MAARTVMVLLLGLATGMLGEYLLWKWLYSDMAMVPKGMVVMTPDDLQKLFMVCHIFPHPQTPSGQPGPTYD